MPDYYESAREAVPEQFEPKTPCRNFETRACVDLSLKETTRYRKQLCLPGNCSRFPNTDREKGPKVKRTITVELNEDVTPQQVGSLVYKISQNDEVASVSVGTNE